jgi:hypothetical protein
MRSMMMVGTAAAAFALGGVTMQEAKAVTPSAPPPRAPVAAPPRPVVTPRPAPAPVAAPKAPTLTNHQLQVTNTPPPAIPPNLPKPPERSLTDKIVNGPGPELKDFKGTNTPAPAQPAPGVEIGRVGSSPSTTAVPQVQDKNSRSYSEPPSGVGVKGTAPAPGG